MIRNTDTSKDSALKQTEVLRNMGLSGRAEMTFQLCDNLRQITKAGIRHRHPDYTEQQVTRAYLSLILNKDLFRQIFPSTEISV
jgi:hypothetical protein